MHICISKLTIIGSDNGLSPGRHQAIIWSNAGILLIEPLQTNFSEISIAIHTFSFKKIHLKMSSGKWRPFCLSLNVLMPLELVDDKSTLVQAWCKFYNTKWPHLETMSFIRVWVNTFRVTTARCQPITLSNTHWMNDYHQTSNTSCTKSQNLNVSHLILQLFLPSPL